MALQKLTTILIVDDVDSSLALWKSLGFEVVTSVPHGTTTGFAILKNAEVELMLQSSASLAEDLPAVAKSKPASLLYADVGSVDQASKEMKGARVLVPRRKTFYGATEIWVQAEDGTIIGLSEH